MSTRLSSSDLGASERGVPGFEVGRGGGVRVGPGSWESPVRPLRHSMSSRARSFPPFTTMYPPPARSSRPAKWGFSSGRSGRAPIIRWLAPNIKVVGPKDGCPALPWRLEDEDYAGHRLASDSAQHGGEPGDQIRFDSAIRPWGVRLRGCGLSLRGAFKGFHGLVELGHGGMGSAGILRAHAGHAIGVQQSCPGSVCPTSLINRCIVRDPKQGSCHRAVHQIPPYGRQPDQRSLWKEPTDKVAGTAPLAASWAAPAGASLRHECGAVQRPFDARLRYVACAIGSYVG